MKKRPSRVRKEGAFIDLSRHRCTGHHTNGYKFSHQSEIHLNVEIVFEFEMRFARNILNEKKKSKQKPKTIGFVGYT